MKNILGFFFGCIIAFSAQGQSALAKLKFEEAEAAFENANYTLSLSKVEDAEKVLGKVNPPLLHLKILSQHRILLSQPAKDLNLAADIITACTNYLSAYGDIESIADKYKEVYEIDEALKGYGINAKTVKGALAGNSDDAYAIASFYERTHQPKRRIEWLQRAAIKGHLKARYELGVIQNRGDDVELLKWYSKEEFAQYPDALYSLGWHYRFGKGTATDTIKGNEYFKKIQKVYNANPSKPDALLAMADILRRGWGIAKDEKEAVDFYVKSAQNGNTTAMSEVAFMFRVGWGVDKNSSEAYNWYSSAAANGKADGYTGLGNLYRDGAGVSKDLDKAKELYKMAAEYYSYAGGYIYLGELYFEKFKENKTALEWFQKAVEVNDGDFSNYGMVHIGDVYAAEGAFQNLPEAFSWYTKAAMNNNGSAMERLSKMYREGKGVSKNEELANKWLEKFKAL